MRDSKAISGIALRAMPQGAAQRAAPQGLAYDAARSAIARTRLFGAERSKAPLPCANFRAQRSVCAAAQTIVVWQYKRLPQDGRWGGDTGVAEVPGWVWRGARCSMRKKGSSIESDNQSLFYFLLSQKEERGHELRYS